MFPNKEQNVLKKQQIKYSGKTKAHTDKTLISYSTNLNQILTVNTNYGSIHDFKTPIPKL